MHITHTFLLSFAGVAIARQAANLDISPLEAANYGCDKTCLQVYNETQRIEQDKFRIDFDYEFYDTAANFSGSKPGDVLKIQALDPSTMTVSAGTTVYRLQYTSQDLDGSFVPVTGFIAFPYTMKRWRGDATSSDPNVFRLVAWAHGTSGLYPGCAPSNGPDLYEGAWQPLVEQGYAVVGTDYAGIGNNFTTHKFLSFSRHATDVYYSVVAAKKAFGHMLSHEWASIGHSQGGGTVWKLAESPHVQDRAVGYLGTVAISPATWVVDVFLKRFNTYPVPGLVTVLPESINRAIPSYNRTFLTPLAQKRADLGQKAKVCFGSLVGLALDLTHDQVVDYCALERDMAVFEEWQSKEAPALGAQSSSPILVLQGQNDELIPQGSVKDAWLKSCSSGNLVDLVYFPGMGHTAMVRASILEWMDWIDGLFTPAKAARNPTCSLTVKTPFDPQHVKAPFDVDSAQQKEDKGDARC